MGLPSILYSLCLHCFGPAAAYSYFFSHHTLPMGLLLTISLFPGSFEPICFLKAHLLISWTCDLLFLPLRLNGFCSVSFANFSLVYVAGLGFLSFIWVSQKDPQHHQRINATLHQFKGIELLDSNGLTRAQEQRTIIVPPLTNTKLTHHNRSVY